MFLKSVLLLLIKNVSSGKEFLRSEDGGLLRPCLPKDSIFMDEICVSCIRPNTYPRSQTCTDFYLDPTIRVWPINSSEMEHSKQTFRSSVILVGQQNSTCRRGFGCLKNENDIEKLKIQRGATLLRRQKLRIVTIERLPFVKIHDGEYTGVCFELIKALKTKYNFSAHIFLPYDGNWGAKSYDGTWNGMVGQVLRKEADVGVAGFSVTFERSRAIAFTDSFHQEPSAILIPPPTEGEKLSVLIRPLSPEVWLSVFLTMAVLAPTLYLMHVTSLRISGELERKGFWTLLGELLHFMVGSLVQESVISPVNKTTRFLVILWWLTTFIIANIYVAYLVSYLSAPKLFNQVNGLDDLVRQNDIKWTFRRNTAHQNLFKSKSSSGIYKTIGEGVTDGELVPSDIDGVMKVLTGKHAFIKESSYLDVALASDFLKTKTCRMTVAKETFFKVETALIVQKQSQILHLFNHEISIAVSTGLMEKWKMIHWPREVWCVDAASYLSSTRPKTRKLQLNDVQGAYFLLFCGTVASIVAIIHEILIGFLRRHFSHTHNRFFKFIK